MAMNDEETATLIAGGHTFGKAHGAANPADYVRVEPEAGRVEAQGLGWISSYGSGKGADTITSGLEGAWTINPVRWAHNYLTNLYAYEWEQTRSPAGAIQWRPAGGAASSLVPDAHDSTKRHPPMMFTTDLALKEDPTYREITSRWLENPEEFEDAFARAWFKLTHRDMGPTSRYLGPDVPDVEFVWQDPIPEIDYTLIDARDAASLKRDILDSGLTTAQLVRTAWASASTYRGTDMRGGANGARIRLAPQNGWEANDPDELAYVLGVLEVIQDESFAVLEPTADGFRNYFGSGNSRSPAAMLVEKAALLELTIPEMTVLVGGMRVLGANADGVDHGIFTDRPGTLTNDFFTNLIDMSTEWSPSSTDEGVYTGRDRSTGELKWTATPVDLIFGSNSELRAVAEFYAAADAEEQFVHDFVDAWTKVMTLDRFDVDPDERVALVTR